MLVESTEETLVVTFDTPLDFRGATNPANYRLKASVGGVPIAVQSVELVLAPTVRGVGAILESMESDPGFLLGAVANSSMAADLTLNPLINSAVLKADSSLTATLQLADGVEIQGNSAMAGSLGNAMAVASSITAGSALQGSLNPIEAAAAIEAQSVVDAALTMVVDHTPDARERSPYFLPSAGAAAGLVPREYLTFLSEWNRQEGVQVLSVDANGVLILTEPLDRLDPQNPSIPWERTLGVAGVRLKVNKPTNGIDYILEVRGLRTPMAVPYEDTQAFVAQVAPPSVIGVELLDDGQVTVTYSDPMRQDGPLTDPGEYTITGPSTVTVQQVKSISDTQVLLQTIGFGDGEYTLEVNATGTPHDVAGNPIDPVGNLASFTGNIPVTTRSIFVDKGPITKPPLSIQTGATASIVDAVTIDLPTASLGPSALGLSITLTGSALNDGTYRITAVPLATQVRVAASFTVPDANDGAISWDVFDPQHGVIADDPGDVTVLINAVPVAPQSVIGLLGQIVLETPPDPTDTVSVDYCWICNPTIEFRRMNSKEFRFNNWNRDNGREVGRSQHRYRYNNSMVQPEIYSVAGSRSLEGTALFPDDVTLTDASASFLTTVGDGAFIVTITDGVNEGLRRGVIAVVDDNTLTLDSALISGGLGVSGAYRLDPLDELAELDQPEQRDLKYRAYERAYTATLNDPNLLLFNSPTHRIAFPPLRREVESVFVNYQATLLPENDPVAPWERKGAGSAAIVLNELVVIDDSTGPFPGGEPVFWTRPDDLTFAYVFAAAWRMTLVNSPIPEGVWTGVVGGYADEERAYIVGYLDDGGVRKFGFLKQGFGNDPSSVSAWTGGIDGSDTATNAPAEVDWSVIHSYRLLRDQDGIIRLYLDGSIVETLRIAESEAPRLSELNAPFDNLQSVFFGSLSRPATNTSTWSFMRYTVQALNPFESAPSVFVSYEGTTSPEEASQPWTPVGSHGTETIVANDFLVLDSTSASDPGTQASAGLVGGDFAGYTRIEPLLQVASDVTLDVDMAIRTFTHGITPNAVMAAVDDGNYLVQLSFLSDTEAPKFSYGGRSLPEDFSPYFWSKAGGADSEMVGQILRIDDTSVLDGLVYFVNDNPIASSPDRVVSNLNDYIMEFRCRVLSHTADAANYAGVSGQVYDSSRAVGLMFEDVAGVKYVTFHSDGIPLAGGQFAFDWDDNLPHTYRFVKSTAGNLVSLFIDSVFTGSIDYSNFTVPAASPVGVISFGASTSASVLSTSTVDWYYANCWRVLDDFKTYAGFWKGYDDNALTGYHLPLKTSGKNADVSGSSLGDPAADFLADGVVAGDPLVVDAGPNKGVYEVQAVPNGQTLTLTTVFPVGPSIVDDYRIPAQTDWTTHHKYRILRDPGGGIGLFLDAIVEPIVLVGYNSLDLPQSSVGVPRVLADGFPSIVWGTFEAENISQTSWDFVRFGITRSQPELGIVPHHQVLNQRNVMASYEHHRTLIAHDHTDFWSESEGIPPQTDPDFLQNPDLVAHTLLNDRTPLVPRTQSYEVRRPTPTYVPVSAFNDPTDLMNTQAFVLNDGGRTVRLIVPDDVLYDCLKVHETTTGEPDLIAPFGDDCNPHYDTLHFQDTVCLEYDGSVLPENDTAAPTPWELDSEDPSRVSTTAFAGILTYGTDAVGTKTIYRNSTPLPDSVSLQTEVSFRLKLLLDSSGGLADSHVRFGFSSTGLTMALAFVTTPLGERYVVVVDLNTGDTVGGIPFDFGDGLYHEYRMVRDPGSASVQISIDS